MSLIKRINPHEVKENIHFTTIQKNITFLVFFHFDMQDVLLKWIGFAIFFLALSSWLKVPSAPRLERHTPKERDRISFFIRAEAQVESALNVLEQEAGLSEETMVTLRRPVRPLFTKSTSFMPKIEKH